MLDFDPVQTALEKLGASTDASEAHGTMCGLLMANLSMASWLEHSLDGLPDRNDVIAKEQLDVLRQLFEHSREQLNDDDFAFEMLLPDESEDFGLRLLALSGWCQGFLYGLGVSGAASVESLDAPAQECLSDMLEISKLSHDDEPGNESEQQYAEVVEHVRMATLMLHESIGSLQPAPAIQ